MFQRTRLKTCPWMTPQLRPKGPYTDIRDLILNLSFGANRCVIVRGSSPRQEAHKSDLGLTTSHREVAFSLARIR